MAQSENENQQQQQQLNFPDVVDLQTQVQSIPENEKSLLISDWEKRRKYLVSSDGCCVETSSCCAKFFGFGFFGLFCLPCNIWWMSHDCCCRKLCCDECADSYFESTFHRIEDCSSCEDMRTIKNNRDGAFVKVGLLAFFLRGKKEEEQIKKQQEVEAEIDFLFSYLQSVPEEFYDLEELHLFAIFSGLYPFDDDNNNNTNKSNEPSNESINASSSNKNNKLIATVQKFVEAQQYLKNEERWNSFQFSVRGWSTFEFLTEKNLLTLQKNKDDVLTQLLCVSPKTSMTMLTVCQLILQLDFCSWNEKKSVAIFYSMREMAKEVVASCSSSNSSNNNNSFLLLDDTPTVTSWIYRVIVHVFTNMKKDENIESSTKQDNNDNYKSSSPDNDDENELSIRTNTAAQFNSSFGSNSNSQNTNNNNANIPTRKLSIHEGVSEIVVALATSMLQNNNNKFSKDFDFSEFFDVCIQLCNNNDNEKKDNNDDNNQKNEKKDGDDDDLFNKKNKLLFKKAFQTEQTRDIILEVFAQMWECKNMNSKKMLSNTQKFCQFLNLMLLRDNNSNINSVQVQEEETEENENENNQKNEMKILFGTKEMKELIQKTLKIWKQSDENKPSKAKKKVISDLEKLKF